ncbi:hypothetical protein PYW07_008068 [Mythimna separata]|uniref:Uncharacterized protein n=1 Tax=Mythimna separata TaxID=271217 RepID=A0AAD7YRM8_MYTSE|nr:hypothetical protein PYW07_008068 [Mythimna separata]
MNKTLKTTSITKFDVQGRKLYIKLVWKNNESDVFHIKIYDGDATWSGNFTSELLKKYSNRCEETESLYIQNVKKYLKESTSEEVNYDFAVCRDHDNKASFAWKKKYNDSEGPIFLVHGSVPVHLDTNAESKEFLLDFLLEENAELRNAINSLNKKNEVISDDLVKCRTELEKFVDIKTSLEVSLYGKFVQLLNAKKRKIQVLEDGLPKYTDSRDLAGDH